MTKRELDNLVRIGQLKPEPPAKTELKGLLRSGSRRLADAERTELSLESRCDLAYNTTASVISPSTKARWTSTSSSWRRCCGWRETLSNA